MRVLRTDGAQDPATAVRVSLGDEDFTLATAGAPPVIAAYRDLKSLAVQPGSALLTLGEGAAGLRIVLEGFGERQAGLLRQLREGRTRQRLRDRMVQLDTDPIEMVEYRAGSEHGVAELAFQPWAAELVPVDESRPLIHVRRAEIGAVAAAAEVGTLRIERTGAPTPDLLELLGLGSAATRLGQRFAALRDGATADATALVTGILPDAAFGTRQHLASLLVDGRPAAISDLGHDGPVLEAAVLSEPTFAESYRSLVARSAADDPVAPRWFALAPTAPGSPEAKAWFFVALPGNLIALELVSAGAHATYLFRIVPRAEFAGQASSALGPQLSEAVAGISNALVDARFLREPMALPEAQLASARFVHYRLALAALPSLTDARRRFVARLVHDDPARWAAALDELIAWHAAARDDAAVWPGRGAEEEAIMGASGSAPDETSGS